MQDIQATILEYEETCAMLKARIEELSQQLSCDRLDSQLFRRRYNLYVELWGAEYAIRELRAYMDTNKSPALAG